MATNECELCSSPAKYLWLNPNPHNPEPDARLFICGVCSYYFCPDNALLKPLT